MRRTPWQPSYVRDCRGRYRRPAENMLPPKGPTPQRITRLLIGRDEAFDEPKLEPFYLWHQIRSPEAFNGRGGKRLRARVDRRPPLKFIVVDLAKLGA